MAKIILEAAGLHLSYGERQLLKIDQLQICDTGRIGLIGENGAGKTTLLRILAGERQPEAGTVRRFVPIAVIHQEGKCGPGEDRELRARFRAQESRESLSGGEMTRNRISEALSSHPELHQGLYSAMPVLFYRVPLQPLHCMGVCQKTVRSIVQSDSCIFSVYTELFRCF